jgi:outer membrane protein OmpA-like peptidoglycan-associated protein
MGDTGRRGPTLVGPTGPVGVAGATGEQGDRGMIGVQGSTTAGVAGAVGPVGPQGDRGITGPTGPQGPTGVVTRWTSYRDFWFESDKAVLYSSDSYKLAEIAAYMKANPSIQLGIDGSTNPRAMAEYTLNLCDARVKAVRDGLITAGVPAYRISEGMFGDVNLRRNGRVEVLIKTR